MDKAIVKRLSVYMQEIRTCIKRDTSLALHGEI